MSPARDRLHDLEKRVELKPDNVKIINELHKENKKLRLIFDKVENIREQIDGIKGNTQRLKNILEKFYNSARKELHAEIQTLFEVFTKKSHKLTGTIKEFEDVITKLKNTDSTEARIQILQCATLKKEFQNVIQENHEIIEKYHNYMKEMYKKSAKIAYSNIDDEELEKMLDEKQMLQIFIDNHMVETEIAIRQLDELKERHAELIAVEEKIREVYNLFLQMSLLVEEQQESLDRVEFHALNAKDYVEQGAVDISKTNKSNKRSRKIKLIMIAAIILLILILLVVLLK